MDTIVTARVPSEIRAQVNKRLAEIGATQTDLINAAYSFVLRTGALPDKAHCLAADRESPEDKLLRLQDYLQRTTVKYPAGFSGITRQEIKEQRLRKQIEERR